MIKQILTDILADVQKAIAKLDGDNSITIKNTAILKEIQVHPWHPTLLLILNWVINTFSEDRIVITSGFRKSTGIHGTNPLRAVDLRSRSFNDPESAAAIINMYWDYGKGDFKVCLYHRLAECRACKHRFEVDPAIGILPHVVCPKCNGVGLTDLGPHFHLQVRNETRKK